MHFTRVQCEDFISAERRCGCEMDINPDTHEEIFKKLNRLRKCERLHTTADRFYSLVQMVCCLQQDESTTHTDRFRSPTTSLDWRRGQTSELHCLRVSCSLCFCLQSACFLIGSQPVAHDNSQRPFLAFNRISGHTLYTFHF